MPEKRSNKIIDIQGRLGAASVVNELAGMFAQGDGDLRDAKAVLQRGMDAFGGEEVVEELCRRLSGLQPDEDATFVLWGLEAVGGRRAIRRLREMMQTPQLASRIRTGAAMVLNALGVSVSPDELPAPAPGDFQEMLTETEQQLDQVAEEERAFVLCGLLDQLITHVGQAHMFDMFKMLVDTLAAQNARIAADMIWAIREFGPEEGIRDHARKALETLQENDVSPTPAMVTGTYAGVFSRAYISNMGGEDPQGQLFAVWEQRPDRLLVLSFMVDYAFWGGAVKDFFVRPATTEEMFSDILTQSRSFGVPMVEIEEAEARRMVVEALQASADRMRPLPQNYRRYHNLVDRMLLKGAFPGGIPSVDDERRSPLPGKAGRVETLLLDRMPQAEYNAEQVRNGRMLWRDYYETHAPSVGKPGVWAAAIDYVIGTLEGRTDQTQQAVANRYGVSTASICNRSGELRDTFIDVEQGAIAYMTEKGPPVEMEDLYDLLGDAFDEEMAEDPEEDYQDYLACYEEEGKGIRKLSFEEFKRFTRELDDLLDVEEAGNLTIVQRSRFRALERVLLLED